MYEYHHIKFIRAIDGDTVELEIDQGNHQHWRAKFRLNGINTPERGQPGYAEAKARMEEMMQVGISRGQTARPDKYGRWLIDLWVRVDGGEMHVNQLMVMGGYASQYFGGAR